MLMAVLLGILFFGLTWTVVHGELSNYKAVIKYIEKLLNKRWAYVQIQMLEMF